MNDVKKPQSGSNLEERGYQPKPNGNFGYQPASASSTPPAPPTSGSNAVKPNTDN